MDIGEHQVSAAIGRLDDLVDLGSVATDEIGVVPRGADQRVVAGAAVQEILTGIAG
jgi:hypothetical protein